MVCSRACSPNAQCRCRLLQPMHLRPLRLRPGRRSDRSFEFALDALPCNAMFCDRELILRYLNRASRKTLLS